MNELYIKIIDEKWDSHFLCNIYIAAYFLNPSFLYDQSTFVKSLEVTQGLLIPIEAMKEIKIYLDRLESFSCEPALSSAKSMQSFES